mmetsp:Transcript_9893/g.28129  ORF Transcript_9893/g.28129 Transcript_9893/m.28129 type:complete len:208 (-) Transcript_9893:199-822(-)
MQSGANSIGLPRLPMHTFWRPDDVLVNTCPSSETTPTVLADLCHRHVASPGPPAPGAPRALGICAGTANLHSMSARSSKWWPLIPIGGAVISKPLEKRESVLADHWLPALVSEQAHSPLTLTFAGSSLKFTSPDERHERSALSNSKPLLRKCRRESGVSAAALSTASSAPSSATSPNPGGNTGRLPSPGAPSPGGGEGCRPANSVSA